VPRYYSKHMTFEYNKNENGLYVCKVCGATKEKQNTMHYHMKRHEGIKSHQCQHCTESFYQKIELTNHIKIIHNKEEPSIQCPFTCNYSFHTKAQCSIHIARTHLSQYSKTSMQHNTETKTYTCLLCNKIFKSHPSILYHMTFHAKSDSLYKDILKSL
jgi:hypothetical protein